MTEVRAAEFHQGAAVAVGPGPEADLDYRLSQAQRGAVERGAPAEEPSDAQRGADRVAPAVQHERGLPYAELSDGRTYPVSTDIGAARQAPLADPVVQPDRVIHRLDHLDHKIELIEAHLSMLADAIYGRNRHGNQ